MANNNNTNEGSGCLIAIGLFILFCCAVSYGGLVMWATIGAIFVVIGVLSI